VRADAVGKKRRQWGLILTLTLDAVIDLSDLNTKRYWFGHVLVILRLSPEVAITVSPSHHDD
jgi:hypothetical protein